LLSKPHRDASNFTPEPVIAPCFEIAAAAYWMVTVFAPTCADPDGPTAVAVTVC
jgi:hypothetical protein